MVNRHNVGWTLDKINVLYKFVRRNISKMSSVNDSVIICDDPSPVKTKRITKRKAQRDEKNKCNFNPFYNLNNKLTKGGMRQPLHPVYESPLYCSNHHSCNGNSSSAKNSIAKSFRGDSHPPVKKPKTLNCNETIVISDDESEPPKRPNKSEIISLKHSNKKVSKKVPKVVAKKVKNKRKSKRLKQKNNMKNASTSGINVDDEDIKVVWTSTNGVEMNKKVGDTTKNPHLSVDDMFFIDNTGDQSNHEKQCLLDDCDQYLPAPIYGKNQKTPTQQKKIKGKNKLTGQLREIIVDGCNVAFGFSHERDFSKLGLELVLDYFRKKGHKVKIFLPQNQRKRTRPYLETWYRRGNVVFTPSRQIGGKTIVPYDDRFIVDYATKCNGIIVTSDQYRDLWEEKPEWRETIEKRLIAPTFVGKYVMFPEDPLGRSGPKLEQFLRY